VHYNTSPNSAIDNLKQGVDFDRFHLNLRKGLAKVQIYDYFSPMFDSSSLGLLLQVTSI
jgi:hypothetical protein